MSEFIINGGENDDNNSDLSLFEDLISPKDDFKPYINEPIKIEKQVGPLTASAPLTPLSLGLMRGISPSQTCETSPLLRG